MLGREPEPSAGIIDPQSAKTTGVGGEQRGFDGRQEGLKVEIVNRSPKPPPEKVLQAWEWFKEGHEMDLSKLPTRPGFENLPRRWVDERTFAWTF